MTTVTLSPQTETLLQEHAELMGQEAGKYEETCQAIAEGFADIDAGRTVSFEEARAWLDTRRAERVNLLKRTGILRL